MFAEDTALMTMYPIRAPGKLHWAVARLLPDPLPHPTAFPPPSSHYFLPAI